MDSGSEESAVEKIWTVTLTQNAFRRCGGACRRLNRSSGWEIPARVAWQGRLAVCRGKALGEVSQPKFISVGLYALHQLLK